jgi:hypothetical protein
LTNAFLIQRAAVRPMTRFPTGPLTAASKKEGPHDQSGKTPFPKPRRIREGAAAGMSGRGFYPYEDEGAK